MRLTELGRLMGKGFARLRTNGVKDTVWAVQYRLFRRENYKHYIKRHTVSSEELLTQRITRFDIMPRISIAVPLYNTPKSFLREMISSVISQSYENWELCLADGSDLKHMYVNRICSEFMKQDGRIRYRKLEKNEGISCNTNACLEMAEGDYIALLDHDDLLGKNALFECVTVINNYKADFIYSDEALFHGKNSNVSSVHFKPNYSPDMLRSLNYICHLTVFSRKLMNTVGRFRPECDGSQDFDMILRLTDCAETIVHIPKVLYFWRSHKNSTAGKGVEAKPYALSAAKKALSDHLERTGLNGGVTDSLLPTTYKIRYEIKGNPLISIVIPNKDHVDDLKKCLNSILEKSTYRNFEIIIVENNSTEEKTFAYYDFLKSHNNIKVIFWQGVFNFSAINNFGFRHTKGEHILLLNNDIAIITPGWLEEMLMFSQRKDVGAVGAKLYYADDTIQHAGVVIGIGGTAAHTHKTFPRDEVGYMGRLTYVQNVSAVTGACMMVPRKVYEETNGLDESFGVAFNDIDLCLQIRSFGYLIVFTPYAELYHYESKSRGYEDNAEKKARFNNESQLLKTKWSKEIESGDPYYNPNFSLDRDDFTLTSR